MDVIDAKNIESSDPNLVSALSDVNMDFLAEAGFSRSSPSHSQHEQGQYDMLQEASQSQFESEENFLGLGADVSMSPRDISRGRGLQVEKEIRNTFLFERREINRRYAAPTDILSARARSNGPQPSTEEIVSAPPVFQSPTDPVQQLLESAAVPLPETSFLETGEWEHSNTTDLATTGPTGEAVTSASMRLDLKTLLPSSCIETGPQILPMRNSMDLHALSTRLATQPTTRKQNEKPALKLLKASGKSSKRKEDKTKNEKKQAKCSTAERDALFAPVFETSAVSKSTKRTTIRRRTGANAHLSTEERKKIRAERNRESAEKSRMRRKQMVLELEANVASLREENRHLKARFETYHGHLTSTSAEVRLKTESAGGAFSVADQSKLSALYEALSALQRCKDECPRTFRKDPHSPVIPLNTSKKGYYIS